ncbi:tetratricopeptide repeat-containing sensor histidine kinase [Aquiflexum lacus]|uniref:tetratricopeptide repeat-containing sensor histidine kinase n=1 Tax=Aquiflexum lacus TaxID=2483805 RepID=UPI001895EEE8|nr:tetratricopeptide repeat-containing sensor histidine kinase [Aquiflexum lacus]
MLTVLLLFFSFAAAFTTQQSYPDSLKSIIHQADNDSIKAHLFFSLSKHYYTFDQDSAIYFANKSIEISEELGLKKNHGNALNILGVSNLIKSDYEAALKAHFEALKIREVLKDSVGMLESNLNLGNIYYRSKELDKAAKFYHDALFFGLKINNQRGLGLIYNNLGSYHLDRWNLNQNQEDFDAALEYLQKSLGIKETLGDNRGMINTLNQLSDLYEEIGDDKKRFELLQRAWVITKNFNDVESKLGVLGNLVQYYYEKGEMYKALDYANQQFEIAENSKSPYQISIAAEKIAKIAASLNNYSLAYRFLTIQKANEEILFNENRQKIRDELTIQYESEKKELENQQLLKDQEYFALSLKRKNEVLMVIVIAVLVLLVLFWIQLKNHRKLKSTHQKLKEAHDLVNRQHLQIQEQAESLHETNKALDVANKFRDKIFSVISHDLRAPFANIQSTISLWNSQLLSNQEMEEVMSMISKNNDAAFLMLENLLDWARTQMESNEVQFHEINLNKLLEENKQLFNVQMNRKNVELINHVPESRFVNSDKERLNFIIRNFLLNAIKFTPEGGKIEVEFKDVNNGEILIKDSGVGIKPELISKLFKIQTLSTKGTAGESGAGIGLMLCKDFAESINAELAVESSINNGSTFIIRLGAKLIPTY